MTSCRGPTPTTRPAPIAPSRRRCRRSITAPRGCASRSPAAIFRKGASAETREAMELVAKALGVTREIEIPEAERARSAAYVITATEGAALHLDRLRTHAKDFDPAVRDRLIAGAMVPAALVIQAQKFRRWYRERMLELFKDVDVILAP